MRELAPELRAVYELARAAQETHEVTDLMARICASVAETFGFDRAAVSRYSPEADEIETVAAHGLELEAVQDLPRSVDHWPFLRRALETRDLVFIEDVRADPTLPDEVTSFGVTSMLTLPFFSGDRCLGFLTADRGGEPFALEAPVRGALTVIGVLAASFLDKALGHEELVRVDRLKTNFIALASHELRTPAAVLYGISATLHKRGDELPPDQLDDLRLALYEQSDRMRALVEQLLDLSRLEAKAIKIEPERFRVRRRVEEVVAAVAPDRLGDAVVEIPAELEACADPNAFERIVSNLVTNAFRYGEPPITVTAAQTDRHFRLAVEDCGRGVQPEFVPQLFERFTRSATSQKGGKGAGLGLSIAQSYAHAHGGELSYRGGRHQGARFELVLPSQI
jgi:signal transduction histidine kinase